MAYDELNDTYTCANGRTLKPIEVKIRESQTGYRKEVTIYECETRYVRPEIAYQIGNGGCDSIFKRLF